MLGLGRRQKVKALLFGMLAATAFAAINGALFHFTEGKHSLLYFGFFGLIPIDWAFNGSVAAMAVGHTHRGINANNAVMFISGALAGLFCTILSHVTQFISLVGYWEINAFGRYLGIFGETWGIGTWYIWLSATLASLTGGFAAFGLSIAQRADNIRSQLPNWVPPTSRILIHVARADGNIDEKEARLIVALIRAQMQKGLPYLPKDFDNALLGVIEAEIEAIKNGRELEHELTEKCFTLSREQRESTAKLAIAIAQCDGDIDDAEVAILDKIFSAWKISPKRSEGLSAEAFSEFEHAL
jgi:tellurite resistance protein